MERGQITLLLAEVACSMTKIKSAEDEAEALSRPKLQSGSERARGEHDVEGACDRSVEVTVTSDGTVDDDKITLFPRRKAGQARSGGGHGPVILSLELLEQFYNMPLHLAAKRLVNLSLRL